ncbi:cytochrome C [Thioalkalivibrio denitrificans]|uniref:Cytochrome C n=1 Tax=Thioalkalivibrio denitrificans TaxID=108003 RepID=A0A1V3NST5_9GAMM|nr:cytochrome c [Thioalkalivibrio denitrificans]OOG28157.1 cytochrome C [Thioalkalivibrio denitrificans]
MLWTTAAADSAADDDLVKRGEYTLRAAGCVSCHTAKEDDAPFLAGGRAIESPFGTFYGANITPDPETGIGEWKVDDLERALRHGRGPDGRHYYPAFPYTSYTRMKREDVEALWAYLQTVEPVRRENRPHELVWYARFRPGLRFWNVLHLRPGEFQPRESETDEWNRGAYLANAMAHCAECHTPRTRTGGLDPNRLFAGQRLPDGEVVPNITPDRETGIGRWSGRHIMRYLDMGMDPEGDFAGSSMADVINDGTSFLTAEDRRAIAVYLMSLEPIRHDPGNRD